MKAAGIFIVLLSGIFMTACLSAGGTEYGVRTGTTVRVLDEAGVPITNADVAVEFYGNNSEKGVTRRDGVSDQKGLVSATGESQGLIRYFVDKTGYYSGDGQYEWNPPAEVVNGKWIPWNPTIDVVLKKIENPVPMYAKYVETYIPGIGSPFGFDLEKGDWVEPYGKGKISDLIFRGERHGNRFENFEVMVEMTFSNEGDGIQSVMSEKFGSELKIPKTAPESGYQSRWIRKIGNTPQTGRYNLENDENQNYIFRVRTVLNKDGSIRTAYYGKIRRYIGVGGWADEKKIFIRFKYYFNPDGTRNLEYDSRRNLLEGYVLPLD